MVAARADGLDLTELLGRYKSYTAKKILSEIETNSQESRKEWLLYLFHYFAKANKQYSNYHFWQYTNHPTHIYTKDVIDQKIEYIHQNPVRAGLVDDAIHYIYSSACLDSPLKVLSM